MATKAAPTKSTERKPRTAVPEGETKEQKLVRLTNARMSKVLKGIYLLGNLASYKPTSSDVDTIMTALGEACGHVEGRLRGAKSASSPFTLRHV